MTPDEIAVDKNGLVTECVMIRRALISQVQACEFVGLREVFGWLMFTFDKYNHRVT